MAITTQVDMETAPPVPSKAPSQFFFFGVNMVVCAMYQP